MQIFSQVIGTAEVYSNYITQDWYETASHDWDTRGVVSETVSTKQFNWLIIYINWLILYIISYPQNLFKFFYSILKKRSNYVKDAIEKLKAFQLTRMFICNLLHLSDCVKQTPKMFEIDHF